MNQDFGKSWKKSLSKVEASEQLKKCQKLFVCKLNLNSKFPIFRYLNQGLASTCENVFGAFTDHVQQSSTLYSFRYN